MKFLLNILFVWLLCINLSSLFITLFPPSNATHCFSEETSLALDRWLYRTTLINLIVVLCLTILFNLILWMESGGGDEEEEGEEEGHFVIHQWLTTYFPLILLTLLYLIGCIVIFVGGIQILAECQYRSVSSLFVSIHCLDIVLIFLLTSATALQPLLKFCQEKCYTHE